MLHKICTIANLVIMNLSAQKQNKRQHLQITSLYHWNVPEEFQF